MQEITREIPQVPVAEVPDPREAQKTQLIERLRQETNEAFVQAFLAEPHGTSSIAGLYQMLERSGLNPSDEALNTFRIGDVCRDLYKVIANLRDNPSYADMISQQAEENRVRAKASEMLAAGTLQLTQTADFDTKPTTSVVHYKAILDGYEIDITETHTWSTNGQALGPSKQITGFRKIS